MVDDDRDIVQVLTVILEDAGYTVATAYSGNEALRSLSETPPDLILMDYMLPDMNGDAVAEKIQKRNGSQKIPIVLVSAAHNAEAIARQASFVAYLPKPFELDQLLNLISAHLAP